VIAVEATGQMPEKTFKALKAAKALKRLNALKKISSV
jgi:hypothetical protein